MLDDPGLRGKPLIVGGGRRGVVSTASYEARKFGVHSAMPIAEAKKLCPRGIFLPPRGRRYAEMSRLVGGVLRNFSPLVEMASIDEAYLDATGMERLFGPVENMGRLLKEAIFRETGGLTCSVGIAPVKFLAKISSELRKPDGLFLLPPEKVADFLASLQVTRIPGVGRKFALALAGIGVTTCSEVMRFPESFWERRFGKAGAGLYQRAQGVDRRGVEPCAPPKSESAETMFEEDSDDREFLKTWLLRHAERVGHSLRVQGLSGRTITLKIKYADFRQLTRQTSLPKRTNCTETIYETACRLLAGLALEGKVRLIGLGVSGFNRDRPCQLSLIAGEGRQTEERRGKLDEALDALRSRYGKDAILRGRLFPPSSPGG
jgi:DNA polymerase-4